MYVKSYERVRAEIEKLPLGIPTEVDLLEFSIYQWRRKIPCDLSVKTRVECDRLIVTRYDNSSDTEYAEHVREVIKAGGGQLRPRLKSKHLVELVAAQMMAMAIYDERSHYLTVTGGYARPDDDPDHIQHLFDIDKWE